MSEHKKKLRPAPALKAAEAELKAHEAAYAEVYKNLDHSMAKELFKILEDLVASEMHAEIVTLLFTLRRLIDDPGKCKDPLLRDAWLSLSHIAQWGPEEAHRLAKLIIAVDDEFTRLPHHMRTRKKAGAA